MTTFAFFFILYYRFSVTGTLAAFAAANVGIHKHCTVTEILVFGRETGFPNQI
jgi:hypothetical protein